ncbi:MAG: ElyC/SanA/YdcF family protein [Patescibacteria group bacterium]
MTSREIPREPTPPQLNEEAIRLLTGLCFRKDDPPQPADLIFAFGTAISKVEMAAAITELLDAGVSKRVLICGGIPKYDDSVPIKHAECETVMELIPRARYSDVEFFLERASTTTLENVAYSLKVLDFSAFGRIFFIYRAHPAGRGYLTLRKFAPKADIFQKTFPARFDDIVLSRENWHQTGFGRSRVWSEYLRIKTYGERGDIAFDEVRDAVAAIETSVS